ncbi:MAG: hypothetical protein ABTD50_02985 [Polyangiaceae bacterium]
MGLGRGRIAQLFREGRAARRSPRRAWLVAAAKFVAVLALLLYPWAGLGTVASAVFCAMVNTVDAVVLPSTPAKMTYELGARAADWRPRVVVRNAATGATLHYAVLQIKRAWYAPMVVFAALAIAWPLALRWSSVAWIAGGLVLLQLTSAICVLVFAQRSGVVSASVGARAAVETVYRVLLSPGLQYALPAVLWLLIKSLTGGWSWARVLNQ